LRVKDKISQLVKRGIIFLLFCLSFLRAGAISDGNENSIKAMFLLNFIKYFEWPVDQQNKTFKIGICGESEVYNELVAMTSNRTFDGRRIEIKRIDDRLLGTYQMIYVASSDLNKLDEVSKKLGGKGVLIISDEAHSNFHFASINLFNQENRIRFEINQNIIKANGLKVSSKLIELSTSKHQ
jgi:Holliday junction resolvase